MSLTRFSAVQVRTPEGILFSLPLAGPIVRCLAWIIDVACISVATALLNRVLGAFELIGSDAVRGLTALGYFVISIGYGITAEWIFRGQTIGKRLLQLRVMDQQGLRLRLSQIVMRNLLRVVDGLPVLYLVGGASCLLTQRMQRLGDLAANTIVVRSSRVRQPDLDQILGGKFNSLLAHRHLAARLRQRVTPEIAAVSLDALLRREQLQPAARIALFHDLAGYFRSLVEFPPEATELLADEQYVRNTVEILFR